MEPGAPSSFIPKKVLATGGYRRRRPVNLLWLIAVFLFLASGVLAGGAYAYQRILDNEINRPCQEVTSGANVGSRRCGLLASVELEERNLDRNAILVLQRLDQKLKAAGEVLNQHNTILPVFRLLEELTLSRIRYNNFKFSGNTITMDGMALNYEDVAVQSQIFASHRDRIQNFIFSDLNRDSQNQVIFKLSLVIEPGLTSYIKSLTPRP